MPQNQTKIPTPADRVTYHVVTAEAPHAGMGSYRRIGLIEVAPGAVLNESVRNTKTQRVVKTWEHLRYGTTQKSAFRRALAVALDEARALNGTETAPSPPTP